MVRFPPDRLRTTSLRGRGRAKYGWKPYRVLRTYKSSIESFTDAEKKLREICSLSVLVPSTAEEEDPALDLANAVAAGENIADENESQSPPMKKRTKQHAPGQFTEPPDTPVVEQPALRSVPTLANAPTSSSSKTKSVVHELCGATRTVSIDRRPSKRRKYRQLSLFRAFFNKRAFCYNIKAIDLFLRALQRGLYIVHIIL